MSNDTSNWRNVPGYENYQVSDGGQIVEVTMRRRYLGQGTNVSGHKTVNLYKPDTGKAKKLYVHRIVLLAFKGECPKGHMGCHYDDNPANNNLDNLRWDTPKGNQADRVRNGVIGRTAKHQPIEIPAVWDAEHQNLAEHHNNLIHQAEQLRHQRATILHELDKTSDTLKNWEQFES